MFFTQALFRVQIPTPSAYRVCKWRSRFSRADAPKSPRRIRSKSTKSIHVPQNEAPIDDYYSLLLSQPLASKAPMTRTSPEPQTSQPATEKEATIQKARVVFGSRLAGPAERRRTIEAKSRMIAGVLVPPRPQEPDNCCMSGCVNCVWDLYRDDLEEWASKSADARRRSMMAQGQALGGSMDENGGGSETGWASPGPDLLAGIPVGIREFMKNEKILKERHRKEGTRGG